MNVFDRIGAVANPVVEDDHALEAEDAGNKRAEEFDRPVGLVLEKPKDETANRSGDGELKQYR